MFHHSFTPAPKTKTVRVDGPWLHDVYLIRDPAGRMLVRIDRKEYEYGGWFNLPLTGGELEALYQAILRAEQQLQVEAMTSQDRGSAQTDRPA